MHKFEKNKSFMLRSGNKTPYKLMGATPVVPPITDMYEDVARVEHADQMSQALDVASQRAAEVTAAADEETTIERADRQVDDRDMMI